MCVAGGLSQEITGADGGSNAQYIDISETRGPALSALPALQHCSTAETQRRRGMRVSGKGHRGLRGPGEVEGRRAESGGGGGVEGEKHAKSQPGGAPYPNGTRHRQKTPGWSLR